MKATYDFGLVGLGVMGRNFLLNVADHGFAVYGQDLDANKVDSLLKEKSSEHKLDASLKAEDLINALSRPRKVMMLVPAGETVDKVIASISPLLEAGDILIDGGNSFYHDTDRRESYLKEKGIHYLGVGISGGSEGARFGPSIMPGGHRPAYEQVRPVLEAVAAKYDGDPCTAYLGQKSAGHYVKMVHNGIEYGLMQLISETYGLLKTLGNYTDGQLHELFLEWNSGPLQSYLIEITAAIFTKPDPLGNGSLLDQILDKARQKGTGKWTSQNAMDLGVAVPSIDAAVRVREISAMKNLRTTAENTFGKPGSKAAPPQHLAEMAQSALLFGYITTYAQGFHLLHHASVAYAYELDLAAIAKIWRSGCIIRAALLQDISRTFSKPKMPEHLMLSPVFEKKVKEVLPYTREIVTLAAQQGTPMPGLFNSLAYFDALTSAELPVNLIQAQRDFFGAHTYERKDREGTFHTEW
ncbi:MAG: NADP-dependent phosphogluconate dehydrogenase [Eudoraea sp.]|nr:NADP-dependent phosphogluconate dehydrogenase [Eudoraea sp.]NNJ39499.1 NADP-dependent phosphogluconate dehydrogenase [Eudoraea sp.]